MRLLIVSNRLPVTVVEKENNLKFQESVGGLVSGLSAYLDSLKDSSTKNSDYLWIGWPGISVDDKIKDGLKERLLSEFNAHPVFLSQTDMENFYHGFCNKTIWPLFHYFPSYTIYDEDYWANYKSVNETFCNAVTEIISPNDVVWIHDYHLMLLPKLLRERGVDVPIGFFLHIPFPTFEVFRLLPKKWRSDILEGLLGADLIGFHTHAYTQYFLRCVLRILGYEHIMGQIIVNDHIAKADTFPMGIDFQKFYNAENIKPVKRRKEKLKKELADFKIILSVDRLDYTKGIIKRLEGYKIFLKKNPQWHKKVVLILVVVPSRVEVEYYKQMKTQIDEFVGKINGEYGSIGWTPILYQYKFLSFYQLTARYSISDVALITPLRDGMNLIAKEYIATRADKTGVLILSEMAGASEELGEAIIINPNNVDELGDAIKDALEMPKDEQLAHNEVMQTRLKRYDVVRWAKDFIQTLYSVKEEQKGFRAKFLDHTMREQIAKNFKNANRRLILLDYDGTLVPFMRYPQMAKPDEELLKLLKRISDDKRNEIVLISGRDKERIQDWFSGLNVTFVAEHGAWIREKNEEWKTIRPLTNEWKAKVIPILDKYVDRLPGSFIEEKEFSVAWHYRKANPELSSLRAKELTDDLVNFTANMGIQILQGNKVVEVRNADINKGTIGTHILSKNDFDFIMAVGDDVTDEDLFKILPEKAYSIRVGMSRSYAKFTLRNYLEVRKFIEQILE